jgi:hypothetical protein
MNKKPSKPSAKPSAKKDKLERLSDRNLERIAKEVERDEYVDAPARKSMDMSGTFESMSEDSRLILLSAITPDDRKERISREPGNEHLFEERPPEGIHFSGALAIIRGDVSSALDTSTTIDEEELE